MKIVKVRVSAVATVAGLVLLGAGVTTAQASKPAPDHKVTLCHRTGSAAGGNQHNGYDLITVDIASVANAKNVRGHDRHNQIGNGPGGDIIPSYTYRTFTYPGKNLGNGGADFLANGCMTVTPPPTTTTTPPPTTTTPPETSTTTSTTTPPETSTTTSTTTPPETSTTTSTTTSSPKPAPEVTVTPSEATDCLAGTVTTTTVTTTTDWVLVQNVWVKSPPLSTQAVTSRTATTTECPVEVLGTSATSTPSQTTTTTAPVSVLGVSATANPLPAAASAGQADTSGGLLTGGITGIAAMIALGAGYVLRRRHGVV